MARDLRRLDGWLVDGEADLGGERRVGICAGAEEDEWSVGGMVEPAAVAVGSGRFTGTGRRVRESMEGVLITRGLMDDAGRVETGARAFCSRGGLGGLRRAAA